MNLEKQKRGAFSVLESALRNKHSDFYRKKYASYPKFKIWESVPFLTRDEIQRTFFFNRLFVPLTNVSMIRPTSGTSGSGVLLMPKMEKKPRDYKPPLHIKYIKQKSLNRAVTFSGAHSYYANYTKKRLGIDYLYLDPGNMKTSAHLFNLYKPEIIYGFPYAITSLIPLLPDDKLKKFVSVIVLFGERSSNTQWQFIQKHFPSALIFSEYASIETQATIAGPCSKIAQKKEKYVHPLPNYVFSEIINPSTGATITKEGASGELVITTISPVAFPLIKYRTGDSATIIRSSCSCVIKTPIISINGRIEIDRVRITGGELNLAEIDRVVSQYQEYITGGDFVVHYTEVKKEEGILKPKVSIGLSWDTEKVSSEKLADVFSRALRVAPHYTYANGVCEGRYEPLTVQFLSQNTHIMGKKKIIRDS